MDKPTNEDHLAEFYKKENIDTSKMTRNDDQAFRKIQQDAGYPDLKEDLLGQLGLL